MFPPLSILNHLLYSYSNENCTLWFSKRKRNTDNNFYSLEFIKSIIVNGISEKLKTVTFEKVRYQPDLPS